MAKGSVRTVLFLGTGNYDRSRLAEVLFNSVAGKLGLAWQASSRGLARERGVHNVGPMALSAIKALAAKMADEQQFQEALNRAENAAQFFLILTEHCGRYHG